MTKIIDFKAAKAQYETTIPEIPLHPSYDVHLDEMTGMCQDAAEVLAVALATVDTKNPERMAELSSLADSLGVLLGKVADRLYREED